MEADATLPHIVKKRTVYENSPETGQSSQPLEPVHFLQE
jgi:hypothetical protein